MSFLPNRTLFYNTDTKRLHRAFFEENDTMVPGVELGDFTFNLVKKTYPFSWVIQLLPGGTSYYPVQMFPTIYTVESIVAFLHKNFPMFNFAFTGNAVNPQDIRDHVNVLALDKETGDVKGTFSVGEIAVQIMLNGENYAAGMVKSELLGE